MNSIKMYLAGFFAGLVAGVLLSSGGVERAAG